MQALFFCKPAAGGRDVGAKRRQNLNLTPEGFSSSMMRSFNNRLLSINLNSLTRSHTSPTAAVKPPTRTRTAPSSVISPLSLNRTAPTVPSTEPAIERDSAVLRFERSLFCIAISWYCSYFSEDMEIVSPISGILLPGNTWAERTLPKRHARVIKKSFFI